ncbi:DUF2567 domain-containing protein [Williamsia sp. CHRR-6]|uniref:DUF2567 domain-containing protein n=1 Tax=Williamsia sp. CHRR-6 TaxID=2835871 RepID=UPI001BDA5CB6|nr:DUF2567 domain-containing protein [Williamsia sp. CHRR-6]MBT0565222.1 DUF2567 domain-containing protein [Williamsia sp. CHRR-6]
MTGSFDDQSAIAPTSTSAASGQFPDPPRIDPSRRDPFAALTPIAVVTGVLLLLGSLGGVVWGLITPGVAGVVIATDRVSDLTADTVHRFDAIAFYACISAVVGVISAVIVWSVRAVRGPIGVLVLVLAGAAGSGLGVGIGGLISGVRHPGAGDTSPGGYFQSSVSLRLGGAGIGALDLSWAIVTVTPTVALIVYLVAVLRARDPALGVREPTN